MIRTESRTVAAVIFLWGIILFSSSPVFLAHGLINVKVVVSSKFVFFFNFFVGRKDGLILRLFKKFQKVSLFKVSVFDWEVSIMCVLVNTGQYLLGCVTKSTERETFKKYFCFLFGGMGEGSDITTFQKVRSFLTLVIFY